MTLIHVVNGPNLNLLGLRQPEHYGTQSLKTIEQSCQLLAKQHQVALSFYQSNHEGALVDYTQQLPAQHCAGMILNPAAYTHSSIALRDALLAVQLPFVEVHLSNLAARESYRQHSFFSDIAIGTISGFGAYGYQLGLLALINHLK